MVAVLINIFVNIVLLLLYLIQGALFVRAIISFIMMGAENGFTEFLYTVTEPFIIPVRSLLERFPSVANMPIDLSFLVTYIILSIVTQILQSI